MVELNRTYNMSDDELAQFTSDLVVRMTRDTTEFAARGVTALDISDLEALGNAFEVLEPDSYYKADVMGAVETKDNLRASIIPKIELISGYFEQEWGLNSWQYTKLNLRNYERASDVKFLYICRNVVNVAEDFLGDLTAIGLTQIMIDDLNTTAQSFEDALNDVKSKKEIRDLKTRERIEKGNELYAFVTKYCRIGKLIWENVSDIKYSEYQIYKKAPDLPSKVMDLNYDSANTKIKWSPAANAVEYELEMRQDISGFDWGTIYVGAAIEYIYTPAAGSWLFRCRGKNANGSGNWSDVLSVTQPT